METAPAMAGTSRDSRERVTAAVRDYGPRLQSFIRHRVRDVADAEDLAQEVLAEFAALDVMQPIERVAGWLLRVARNRIVDWYRARARERRIFEPAGGDGAGEGARESASREPGRLLDSWRAPVADSPESAYERAEFLDALEIALAELPAAQREVFIAHELEGRSFKELAAQSGESINTLLGRKHDAVRQLRVRLREQQIELEE